MRGVQKMKEYLKFIGKTSVYPVRDDSLNSFSN